MTRLFLTWMVASGPEKSTLASGTVAVRSTVAEVPPSLAAPEAVAAKLPAVAWMVVVVILVLGPMTAPVGPVERVACRVCAGGGGGGAEL